MEVTSGYQQHLTVKRTRIKLDKSRRRVKQAIGYGYWKEACQVH